MFIRQVHAYEDETVEIRWTLHDGTEHTQMVRLPPESRTKRCPNCAVILPAESKPAAESPSFR